MLVKYTFFLYTAPKLMRAKVIALENRQLQGTEFFFLLKATEHKSVCFGGPKNPDPHSDVSVKAFNTCFCIHWNNKIPFCLVLDPHTRGKCERILLLLSFHSNGASVPTVILSLLFIFPTRTYSFLAWLVCVLDDTTLLHYMEDIQQFFQRVLLKWKVERNWVPCLHFWWQPEHSVWALPTEHRVLKDLKLLDMNLELILDLQVSDWLS